jgi:hypothetical protein
MRVDSTITRPLDEQFPLDPARRPGGPAPDLSPGTAVEIVKLDPDGAEVVRYPGVVLPGGPDGWVVTEARWTNRSVMVGDLPFRTGDRLVESFHPALPYNCFAVHDPDSGELRGWYANVTYPTRFDPGSPTPSVTWQDLYLDVVATVGNAPVLLDADELAASGMEQANPGLHAAVVAAAARVRQLMMDGRFPFTPDAPGQRS